MNWHQGYTNRWIKLGGKKDVFCLHDFGLGLWLLLLGPLRLHHFGKRYRRWILPWRSREAGSIHWLRLSLGFRGPAQ